MSENTVSQEVAITSTSSVASHKVPIARQYTFVDEASLGNNRKSRSGSDCRLLGSRSSLYGLFRIIRGKPEESVTEVQNVPFKVVIRSQEFLHSGTVNIDICVAETQAVRFL